MTETHARIAESSLETKPTPLSSTPHTIDRKSPMPPVAPLSSSNPSPPAEVEATLSRLTAHQGVLGCLVLSRQDGLVIRSGGQMFEPSGPGATDRADMLKRVVKLVRSTITVVHDDIKGLDESDELGFLRIRTKKHEIMITPSEKYLLVVIQDPTASQ